MTSYELTVRKYTHDFVFFRGKGGFPVFRIVLRISEILTSEM